EWPLAVGVFLRPMAATSICITSATAAGSPLSSRPESRRSGGSPISGTRSRPSRSALRAGISTFEPSRYMGTSLGMIDRHYGHLARAGRQHATKLLDQFTGGGPAAHAGDA